MKLPSNVLLALSFVGALLILFVGAWVVSALVPNTTTGTEAESGGFFASLFPFTSIGGGGGTDTPEPGASEDQGPVPAVRQLTDKQVAGATFAISNGTEVVRFVERETGHIYEVPVNAYTSTRLTNTTVPAVHDALWVSASSTILRFLGEDGRVENFYGFFSSTTPDQSLQGAFIKPYKRIAIGAGGALIAGVLETTNATVETADPTGDNTKTVLVSPIRSWVPIIAGNRVLVASAPAFGMPGSLYDTTGGRLSVVSDRIDGLEALPNRSGSYVLLSGGTRRSQTLSLIKTDTGASAALPRATTVSKCAWVGTTDTALCAMPKELPLADYPNDWLLGRVHTEDDLWLLNATTGMMTVGVELSQAAEKAIDVSKLVVNSTGVYATFIDRNDGSLWLTSLSQ